MDLKPTAEQLDALSKFSTKEGLKIAAFAGAGKTSTLQLLAKSRKGKGLYLAFNKSIAAEAKQKFPQTVDCRTTHSIAWRTVQPTYKFSNGKMKTKLHANQLAESLELKSRVFGKKLKLNELQQAFLLTRTLQKFCQSADTQISKEHVPQYGRLMGMPAEVIDDTHQWAVENAKALWARMIDRHDKMPLGHDGYLKLWAMGKPELSFEYILLDEAQDTNPVVLGVLTKQPTQMVYVGDKHQQIYEWRGAINAMEQMAGLQEAYLTQSFRFGRAIAETASSVLRNSGESHDIRGNPLVSSVIVSVGPAGTVLCRTNATVIKEILDALGASRGPHVVGGTDELKRLLSDVFELQEGKPGTSPEFFGFQNWNEVLAHVEEEEGEDVKMFVQLVQQHGPKKLWKAVSSVEQSEDKAGMIISTAHKAKGREWDTVRLAPDFLSTKQVRNKEAAEAEIRLFYVAMTRAKKTLVVDSSILHAFTSGEGLQSAARPTSIGLVQKEKLVFEKAVQPKKPPHVLQPLTAEQVTRNRPLIAATKSTSKPSSLGVTSSAASANGGKENQREARPPRAMSNQFGTGRRPVAPSPPSAGPKRGLWS